MTSMQTRRRALCLLAAVLLLMAAGACAPRPRETSAAALERIYAGVPREQVERLRQFRAGHPYKEVTAGGARWHYIACGSGEQTLVLLPGVSRQAEATFVLIGLLEGRYRLLVPSYPPVSTMGELADGLAGILEAEGVEQAAVWGTSFGGMVAHVFVHRYPEKVSKLIVANSGMPNLSAPVLAILGTARYWPTPLAMAVLRQALSGAEEADDPERDFWRARLNELFSGVLKRADAVASVENSVDFVRHGHYAPDALAAWKGQVLFLESENDQSISAPEREALRAQYPQAEVYVFKGAPHEPWRTHREEYVRVLTGFLDRQER